MSRDRKESSEEIERRIIDDEYKIWMKNTPFLYDLVITHAMEWPSLTVEWLPGREEPPDKDHVLQKMVLGTVSRHEQLNYLIIAQVQLPREDSESDAKHYAHVGGFANVPYKFEVIQRIPHDGEVNRARYMPQNQSVIATKTKSADVYIFDCSKHPPVPPSNNTPCRPDLKLKGHKNEGYGLSWSKHKPGHLLSGSEDSRICMWDVNATPTNKTLLPTNTYKAHKGAVQDVAWHSRHEHQFGSVGNDKYLCLWDLRSPSAYNPVQSTSAHDAEVNCLAFNPINEWVVATGSADTNVKLFDTRKFESALHTFDCHTGQIFQVGWSPTNQSILASCCTHRRLLVWDLSRIYQKQAPEEAVDGPPELLFIHGGHTARISDFSWNPSEDWIIASVAEDNIVQIWQMADNIYHDEDDH